MNYEQLQTTIEIQRERLFDILLTEGFSVHNMIDHIIEEYHLGLPLTWDYTNFRDHFTNRIIKEDIGDERRFRHSHVMTQVLEHLFIYHIRKCYFLAKDYIYDKLDKLAEKDELWSCEYIANFSDWRDAWCEEFCNNDDFPVKFNWDYNNEQFIALDKKLDKLLGRAVSEDDDNE